MKLEKRSVLIQNYNLSQIQNSNDPLVKSNISNKDPGHSKVPKLDILQEEEKNNLQSEELESYSDLSSHQNKMLFESTQTVNYEFLRTHHLKQYNICLQL